MMGGYDRTSSNRIRTHSIGSDSRKVIKDLDLNNEWGKKYNAGNGPLRPPNP